LFLRRVLTLLVSNLLFHQRDAGEAIKDIGYPTAFVSRRRIVGFASPLLQPPQQISDNRLILSTIRDVLQFVRIRREIVELNLSPWMLEPPLLSGC